MGSSEVFGLALPLHAVAQGLLVPVIALLTILVMYTVYTLGALIVEVAVERRHFKAIMPDLIDSLHESPMEGLGDVIEGSGLLASQREVLTELVKHLPLPTDARTEVARGLLAQESDRYQKVISRTESISRVAPMLGLMGTLIPLGPGILALSNGDLETLSSSLLIAFDTTVAGLAVAVVMLLVTRLRRRWYNGYLVSVESSMNTLLEKAEGEVPDGEA